METTINKIELTGYAGMQPEVKEFENGSMIARFSMATHERFKSKEGEWVEETTWHKVVVKNKLVNDTIKSITKGVRVHVLGKISNRPWTDSNGIKHTITEVIASQYDIEKKGDIPLADFSENNVQPELETESQAVIPEKPKSKKSKIN